MVVVVVVVEDEMMSGGRVVYDYTCHITSNLTRQSLIKPTRRGRGEDEGYPFSHGWSRHSRLRYSVNIQVNTEK